MFNNRWFLSGVFEVLRIGSSRQIFQNVTENGELYTNVSNYGVVKVYGKTYR